MHRIDLVKLRKRAGMSQRELAELLNVRPSFLSAIENGRSRLPEEKMEKILEIFELENLNDYIIEEKTQPVVPPHTHDNEDVDSISKFLNHFHELAHLREKKDNNSDNELASRIDYLTRRNDRLSDRIDELRDEVDELRRENLKLKELLIRNNIDL